MERPLEFHHLKYLLRSKKMHQSGLGCWFEAYCSLAGAGLIGGVPSVGVFLRDPSLYLCEFRFWFFDFRLNANCQLMEPEPIGGVTSVGGLTRVSEKTTENYERLGRQARPGFEPGTSHLRNSRKFG